MYIYIYIYIGGAFLSGAIGSTSMMCFFSFAGKYGPEAVYATSIGPVLVDRIDRITRITLYSYTCRYWSIWAGDEYDWHHPRSKLLSRPSVLTVLSSSQLCGVYAGLPHLTATGHHDPTDSLLFGAGVYFALIGR